MEFDICFRIDYSIEIGGGHLTRSLQILKNKKFYKKRILLIVKGKKINFKLPTNYHVIQIGKNENLEKENLKIKKINIIKLTVIDAVHQYSLKNNVNFHNLVLLYKNKSNSTAIFDGVGIGSIYNKINTKVDLLISPYLGGKKINNQKYLSGAKYFIFDPTFLINKRLYKKKYNKELTCLISFGKSDPYKITEFVLKSIINQKYKINFKVICGEMFEEKRIKLLHKIYSQTENIEILRDIKSLKKLYQISDICVCSSGHTKYESCFFGLKTIIISMNDEDAKLQKQFDKFNLAMHIGSINKISSNDINMTIRNILNNKINTKKMLDNCKKTFDGLGYKRVCEQLFALM